MRDKVKEYFPHDEDATDDPKMMILISQLGLEGYGIYWVLIEYLRKQPGYIAPLMIVDSLARRFGSSREKFEVVISKYNDSFDTPLFVIDDTVFYSPSLQNRMLKLDEKREKMKSNALKRWDGDANAMQLHSKSKAIPMQSKVKESRVKKSKVKESKEEITPLFLSPDFNDAWTKWVAYKKKIGKPYKTLEGMEGKYNELVSLSGGNPAVAMKIVEQSIRNEWAGLFALKGNSAQNIGEDPVTRMMREANEAMNKQGN